MPNFRRTALAAGLLTSLTMLAAPYALAQTPFPSKPLRIVVPYAAGGSTDQLARAIQPFMSSYLKQPVIVENKVGAGGAIGTDFVAKSAADGYTLVFGNSGPNAVLPLLRKLPYDSLTDLRPISTVAITPMILAIAADSPAKNLKEFIAAAKQSAGQWNFGSVGNGSLSHLTGEYFNNLAGLRLAHVPYNGGAPMMMAFGGGQLQAAFVTGLDGQAMVQAGKVRYIAVATPQRTNVVAGLPAIAEEVPGFRSVAWFGVLAPRGVSDAVAAKLNEAVLHAVAQPEVKKMFADRNIEARGSTPAEMERMIRDEMAQWGAVAKQADIRLE
ncbi:MULTISPECIES: Bug family tripartite tricarboxylate transporter substrate binding protein [Delftia]|uniref:Tripartite tricarboxylate transporter substrate binding protein n=1 Tax=Delftia lacustris TaxID=558537 RepID=A0A1H3N738_9BURK|nr:MULTISPECIES: tripartite tricarboxylate transporter substrate binding protein [Delftia]MDH0776320.1 tripartite tricarboxylate transporter substrate binding protein [Delftia tsuruhatensis]MDH1459912.1 tripartite tricarboxylate transporter substrate binding protein [Delftia tsuruhatensis]MDH1823088.1 tripartite tricarboxylate transporter substrate binding protein [Delftia tsuruhatensis]QPS78264.1 tripartite tricarboxylate transporter substrate binding protein [Delftia acidovorans]QPS84824.1 t